MGDYNNHDLDDAQAVIHATEVGKSTEKLRNIRPAASGKRRAAIVFLLLAAYFLTMTIGIALEEQESVALVAVAVIFLGLIMASLGAVASIPAWVWPLRKLGWDRVYLRAAKIFIFGLLAFVIVSWLSSRLGAQWMCWPGHSMDDFDEGCLDHVIAITNELFLRNIVPPPLSQTCYTKDVTICELADGPGSREYYEDKEWSQYLRFTGFHFVSALVCGTLVWYSSRPRFRQAK
jgi:hypothetical protein